MTGRVRSFTRDGVTWRVEEATVPMPGAAAGGGRIPHGNTPALRFQSAHGTRFRYDYPRGWHELDGTALAALLPQEQ